MFCELAHSPTRYYWADPRWRAVEEKSIYLLEDFFLIHLPMFKVCAILVGWSRFALAVH